jgi:hypothetical protein
LQQTTNDGLFWSVNDFNHPGLGSTLAIEARDPRNHTVSVNDGAHLVGWQIDIGLAIITLDKAMSISMPFDSSFEGFEQTSAGG